MDKKWLAGLTGLLDPALINLAQEIAEKIPQGSLLRSKAADYILGVLRGLVETHAEKFSAASGVAVEKLTDLSEFLSATLAQGGGAPGRQDLVQNFLAETAQRLQKAENPQQEAERIKAELVLFKEISSLAHKKEDSESSSPFLEILNQKLEKVRDDLKAKEASHGQHR